MRTVLLMLLIAVPPVAAQPRVLWKLPLSSDSKGGGAIADLDGDGKPEIVFGAYYNDAQLYAVGASDGKLRWKYRSEGGPFDASVAIADLDGDGRLEVLAADSATGTLFCLDGEGRLLWKLALPSGTDSPPAVGDLDGDGKPEVVAGAMWRRIGGKLIGSVSAIDPRARRIRWQAPVEGCVQTAPCLVDLDGDGRLDVVVASWRGDRGVHAFRGTDGKPLWRAVTAGDARSMGMYHGVALVAAAGKPRLVAATGQGDVYCLDAAGRVVWRKNFPGEYLFAATSTADLDGDGTPELIVGGRRLHVLRAADGATLWQRSLGASIDRGAVAADVDGDGKLDVLVAAGRTIHALSGTSGKTIWIHDATLHGRQWEEISSGLLLADVDGDRKLDLFYVIGRGLYGGKERGTGNYGQAVVLSGVAAGGWPWPVFRGNLRRTGGILTR